MNIDTSGRNPSLNQYVLRGAALVVVLAVLFSILYMRYQGVFSSTTPVTAELTDVGDGLVTNADVRYNGYIVGQVKSVDLSGDTTATGQQLKMVRIDLKPEQAKGIPRNVTARTVPSNLFGVNSVELVQPHNPVSAHVGDNAKIPADQSLDTIKLQDAQNQLRTLLNAVPPEQLASMLGTVSDALKGGGATFGQFVPVLDTYWKTLNAQFPPGAPSGFDNFNATVKGLARSAPQLLDTLGRSVVPAMTIAQRRDDLTALLSATGGVADEAQALFAKNGDTGKRLVPDANRMLGALVYEPDSIPQALTALNAVAAQALTIFTGVNGHIQLNLGISFSAYQRYTRQNCPVYDGGPYGQLRGPGCTGPGTGTGPTSSGPLMVYPSPMQPKAPSGRAAAGKSAPGASVPGKPTSASAARGVSPAGSVTTGNDDRTLQAALQRKPGAADTLMLGPLVQSVTVGSPGTLPGQGGRR